MKARLILRQADRGGSSRRFTRTAKAVLAVAFLVALAATIVGMGPLAFLSALGVALALGAFKEGIEALLRSGRRPR
jgi:hypothetical protein